MNIFADMKAEARARNKRLARMGMPNERPGGKPGDLNKGGTPSVPDDDIRTMILAFLADGVQTRTKICYACGNHQRSRDIIDALVAEGVLIETQVERTWRYEVAK